MTGSPETMPGPGASSGSAARRQRSLQCPRCKHSVRYRACPQCRLGLYCRACGVRLTDPLRQTACDVCGEAIEQTAYPAVTSEAPAAATASPASATVPPLVPPSQTTAKVEELVGSFRGAGSVRREAADYAAALMANGQLTDALAVLAGALAEVWRRAPGRATAAAARSLPAEYRSARSGPARPAGQRPGRSELSPQRCARPAAPAADRRCQRVPKADPGFLGPSSRVPGVIPGSPAPLRDRAAGGGAPARQRAST